MSAPDATVAELRDRLRRYPADRYPVQHATARYHLGTLFATSGAVDDARRELEQAAALFAERLPVEHAQAVNLLGAVTRQAGDPAAASRAFERAAAAFDLHDQPRQAAAARFNLGLALCDTGDLDRAIDCFERAHKVFTARNEPRASAAAGRELGAARLRRGELDAAVDALTAARDLAASSGDPAGAGAASNLLGLAHLAAGRGDEAAQAFEHALAAHPRAVRPDAHAMARANLALAHERAGRAAHARLCARHALAVRGAPDMVRAEADGVLKRLEPARGDLFAVLDDEPEERWRPLIGEEVLRLADAGSEERAAEAAAWVEGLLARSERMEPLCEAWLAALLEVPPPAFGVAVAAAVDAAAGRPEPDRLRFHDAVERASARFHVPQLLRLREGFRAAGTEISWS